MDTGSLSKKTRRDRKLETGAAPGAQFIEYLVDLGCLRGDLLFQTIVFGKTAQLLGPRIGEPENQDRFLQVGVGAERQDCNPGNAHGQFSPPTRRWLDERILLRQPWQVQNLAHHPAPTTHICPTDKSTDNPVRVWLICASLDMTIKDQP